MGQRAGPTPINAHSLLYARGKKKLVHMVSAWAEGNGPVLGQHKVDEKSNEIAAIPNNR